MLAMASSGAGIGLTAAGTLPSAAWSGGLGIVTYPLTIAAGKLILELLPIRF